MIKEGIQRVVDNGNLSSEESELIMKEIMNGEATPSQISSFLTALRMKGETIEEIVSFVTVMRKFAKQIKPKVTGRLLDIVGTGGDKIKTINVSTPAALLAAGAGVSVAKHGNRSFTSKCGSADLLEKFGLNLESSPILVEKSIETIGIGFMFAPIFHQSMKHVIGTRREIGIRTMFNILGPLTNPAEVNSQLVGVYDESLVKPLAEVLARLGLKEGIVAHGQDGIDEISTIGLTSIAWMKNGKVNSMYLNPKDFGVDKARPEDILGGTPDENAESIFKILINHREANHNHRDLILVNAAAGIIVGGLADTFNEGMELANNSIRSGSAYNKLKSLISMSEGNVSKLENLEKQFA